MKRGKSTIALVAAAAMLLPGVSLALTRELAELQPASLSFDRSVLNQVSFDIYRDPFDELQTRPYNLLFSNIGRHSNLSPWPDQEGNYTRYLNALIGNNGRSNIDNDADAIQGSFGMRQTDTIAWGVSAAFLGGNLGSDDSNVTTTFTSADDLAGVDLRGSAAFQLSEQNVLGAGIRLSQAGNEFTTNFFEQGVGGNNGTQMFDQTGIWLDAGVRHFISASRSWEVQGVLGFVTYEQDEFSEAIDAGGVITDRFIATNYDITDLNIDISAGYNFLRREKLGETGFRVGIKRSERELDNSDLSFSDSGGVVTPETTLLGQDPVTTTGIYLSAQTIFPAGETEVYTGGQLGYSMVSGATQIDAQGVIVNEEVDDSFLGLGLTLGLRQPLFKDKLRFIVSGRADILDEDVSTTFDTGSDTDTGSQTLTQYAIALEGVLANVVFDLAWIAGEEATVVPIPLGLPEGSRKVVEVDRLIVSAAVSW
jgi:hypothetical protein